MKNKMEKTNPKTKKVSGAHLIAENFLYVGDPENTSTWHIPLCVPGNVKETIHLLRTSLGKFHELHIPEEHRRDCLIGLVAACKAHHIKVEAKAIALSGEELSLARESVNEVDALYN